MTALDWVGALVNAELLEGYGMRLLYGLQVTAEIVVISCSLGFVLAYPISQARLSRFRTLRWLSLAFVTYFRGVPLLCQLYLAYYGAGEFRPLLSELGLWWFFRDAFYCCIFCFTLNTAAYQAEILRGAVQAVPKGQREAAVALGLSRYRMARHVVWPQALLVALPPLGNELISMVKASALAAIVTLLDLMGQTRFVFARTFDFSIYVYCALIYLAITEAIGRVWHWAERRLSRHMVPRGPATLKLGGTASSPISKPAMVDRALPG